jgi:DNA-binding NarL/FixJ family response regulator
LTTFEVPGAPGEARIRVLCVDHHPIILAGISAKLSLDPRLEVVGLVGGMIEAQREFERLRPDIVLTELGLPGFPGADPVRAFRRIDPEARVLVLTTSGTDQSLHAALEAGAAGFLLKARSIEEIGDAIDKCFSGAQVLDPEVAPADTMPAGDALVAPEIEALQMLARGTRTSELARSLQLDLTMARAVILSAVGKLGAENRTQAVMLAKARGLIGEG